MNILDWFDSVVVNGIFSVTDEDDASVNWNDQSWFEENIAACRKNTPIFGNELSFDEFCDIAHKAAKKIKRIKRVRIDGAIITCTVESQSGITDWDFTVDFNDWGHVSGVFWLSYGNLDSTIPRAYADKVSLDIIYLLMERKVERKNHSAIVNYDIFSGQIEDEQEFRFKNLFLKPNRQLITDYSTTDLICEHAFYALCCLKKNGFKNVILVPVKDIDEESDNYLFEVESISVAGKDSWEKGAIFLKNSKVT